MTRETRVGLVLGLMFVIAFGMILSRLKGTGELVAPGPVSASEAETEYYRQVEPEQQDLAFGPAPQENLHPIHLAAANTLTPEGHEKAVQIRVLSQNTPAESEPIAASIRREPAEALAPPPAEQPVRLEPQPIAAQTPATPAPAKRIYRVQPDDSLYAIAEKVYGPNQGRLYGKIFEANRDQLESPDSILAGMELRIPNASNRPASPRVREMDLEELRQFVRTSRGSSPRRVYVVQRGDNLTRIARKVLHDDSRQAVNRLFEANRDKLQDPDNVIVGMELRIPS